ncbi:hypothetical protein PoB_007223000 [Plakobranchus ocellatus]|uniref:Uncharacterized protein n=1 Tax=Plakobranchus ocellatus TaxID=259542 RepID=A0AAV4DP71_9GAST|nr:hypothetical protein PoB_007223000 [Plakobranchus ocellatus]
MFVPCAIRRVEYRDFSCDISRIPQYIHFSGEWRMSHGNRRMVFSEFRLAKHNPSPFCSFRGEGPRVKVGSEERFNARQNCRGWYQSNSNRSKVKRAECEDYTRSNERQNYRRDAQYRPPYWSCNYAPRRTGDLFWQNNASDYSRSSRFYDPSHISIQNASCNNLYTAISVASLKWVSEERTDMEETMSQDDTSSRKTSDRSAATGSAVSESAVTGTAVTGTAVIGSAVPGAAVPGAAVTGTAVIGSAVSVSAATEPVGGCSKA